MNEALLKFLITICVVTIVSIINYLLLKKNKKTMTIILIIICIVELLYFLIDSILFHIELFDYIGSQLLITFLLSITFEDVLTNNIDLRIIILFLIIFAIYRVIFLDINIIYEGLAGFVFCFIIFIIPFIIKRDLVGLGDILTVSACGMIIGYPSIFNFLFKTFLLVFLFGLYLIIFKKKNTMTEIPLAPFLLIATII